MAVLFQGSLEGFLEGSYKGSYKIHKGSGFSDFQGLGLGFAVCRLWVQDFRFLSS